MGKRTRDSNGRKRQGIASSHPETLCHTFTVYDEFRIVTVRSHQYCFVLYLLFTPFRLSIDDFEQLHHVKLAHYPILTVVLCPEVGSSLVG